MRVIYYNIHIPKNAGSTFNRILQRCFSDRFFTYPNPYAGNIYSQEEKRDFLLRNEKATCISGHGMRYSGPPVPGVSYRYMTFLRHPVERLVSLYAYEQRMSPETHSSHRQIDGWIDRRLNEDNALTNYQAFHIIGTSNPIEVSFEQARDVLNRFFFIGLAEMFDESLVLFRKKMHVNLLNLRYEKRNVTDSRVRFPISKETRQRLIDLNRVDMQLYEWAHAEFSQLLSKLAPEVISKVKLLRFINKLYSRSAFIRSKL